MKTFIENSVQNVGEVTQNKFQFYINYNQNHINFTNYLLDVRLIEEKEWKCVASETIFNVFKDGSEPGFGFTHKIYEKLL